MIAPFCVPEVLFDERCTTNVSRDDSICQAIQPQLAALLAQHPEVRHVQIEDGPGRPLGRSFGVKLWPTLVFMRDGKVIRQAVRSGEAEIAEGFTKLTG